MLRALLRQRFGVDSATWMHCLQSSGPVWGIVWRITTIKIGFVINEKFPVGIAAATQIISALGEWKEFLEVNWGGSVKGHPKGQWKENKETLLLRERVKECAR